MFPLLKRPLPTLLVAFVLLVALAACSPSAAEPTEVTPLPPGDATHGAQLFVESVNNAPTCHTCHELDETSLVGPGMKGYGARAATRVEGLTAIQYTYESITKPASYVVPGFANGMYNGYASKLSQQDIADLIAYLLNS